MKRTTFDDVVTAAVEDLADQGYDSPQRLAFWQARLREAADAAMRPAREMEERLRDAMVSIYRRLVDRGVVLRRHPGVERFTLQRVAPHLRAELDRRIMASADLIRLNRTEAVQKTLQRFAGWATSVPKGGSKATDKPEVKQDLKKSLRQLPFVERRVLIDQGHKLSASISEIVAKDGGAIAGTWHSHWRQRGYNYRPDHKERDELVYMLRGNWAQERGLAKPGPDGYYDEITSVGEEPFCRCYMTWLHALRDLPDEMVTAKGRAALQELKANA